MRGRQSCTPELTIWLRHQRHMAAWGWSMNLGSVLLKSGGFMLGSSDVWIQNNVKDNVEDNVAATRGH